MLAAVVAQRARARLLPTATAAAAHPLRWAPPCLPPGIAVHVLPAPPRGLLLHGCRTVATAAKAAAPPPASKAGAVYTYLNNPEARWNQKYVRLVVRASRLSGIAMGLFGCGHILGQISVAEDPDGYDYEMLASVIRSHCNYGFLIVSEHDYLKGGEEPLSARADDTLHMKLTEPSMFYFPEKNDDDDVVMFGNSKRKSINENSKGWKFALQSQRVFRRVKAGAQRAVEEEITAARERKLDYERREMWSCSDREAEEIKKWKKKRKLLRREWRLVILDTSTPNAFVHASLPGRVFVTAGLFKHFCKDDDELAACLGHELSHVLLDHSADNANKKLFVLCGTLVAMSLLDPTGFFSLLTETILLNFHESVVLSFTREHEREADEWGMRISTMACYNPERAMSLFSNMEKFSEECEGGHHAPTLAEKATNFFETHPLSAERVENAKDMMPGLNSTYSGCTVQKKDLKEAMNKSEKSKKRGWFAND